MISHKHTQVKQEERLGGAFEGNVAPKGVAWFASAVNSLSGTLSGQGTQDDMALSRRDSSQPRSAPASPTMDRKRPVTFQPLHRVRFCSASPSGTLSCRLELQPVEFAFYWGKEHHHRF